MTLRHCEVVSDNLNQSEIETIISKYKTIKDGKIEGKMINYDKFNRIRNRCHYKNNNCVSSKPIFFEELNEFYQFEQNSKYNDDDMCFICRSDEHLIILNCHHTFHLKCLLLWFKQSHQDVYQKCPLCFNDIEWNKCKNVIEKLK